MRVRVDHAGDAVYLNLTDRPVKDSTEVADGIVVDYDDEGRLVGVEILDASKRTDDHDVLKEFSFELPTDNEDEEEDSEHDSEDSDDDDNDQDMTDEEDEEDEDEEDEEASGEEDAPGGSEAPAEEPAKTCPECGGSRRVEEDCPHCQGSRQNMRWGEERDDPCPDCGGSGRVTVRCRSC
jgi:uncharacterized protein YuzE